MAASMKLASDELKKAVNDVLKGGDLAKLSSKKVRKQLEEKYGQDLTDRKKEIDGMVMDFIENGNKDQSDAEDERENGTNDKDASSGEESDFEAPEDDYEPVPMKKKSKKSDSDSEVDDEKLAQQLQIEEDDSLRKTRGGRGRRAPTKRKSKSAEDEEGKPKKKRKGPGMYSQELILSAPLAEVMCKERMARSDVVKRMWEIVKERNLKDPKQGQFMLCDEQLQKVFGRKRVKTFGMMKYLKDHLFKPEEL